MVDASLPAHGDEKSTPQKTRKALESTLDVQVHLFTKAKREMAAGNFEAGLRVLNHLKQRYPTGPLRPETEELEARGLTDLHRHQEASRVVIRLIHTDITTRKKAQLYRFLGDLQLKQNRCDEAAASYRTALGLGLSEAESEAARAGNSRMLTVKTVAFARNLTLELFLCFLSPSQKERD